MVKTFSHQGLDTSGPVQNVWSQGYNLFPITCCWDVWKQTMPFKIITKREVIEFRSQDHQEGPFLNREVSTSDAEHFKMIRHKNKRADLQELMVTKSQIYIKLANIKQRDKNKNFTKISLWF